MVARNSHGVVRYALSDAGFGAHRVRYARAATALYVPAWSSLGHWSDAHVPDIECDVSEIDGRSCWRYLWMRGRPRSLHPTGSAGERRAWRDGVNALRHVVANMPSTDHLALENFGIVRIDVRMCEGVALTWEEYPRAV